ncbi:MAG: MCE family protein [Lentisphaerae bacterium]|nr:MCE family protein [Lentisphaerota bacterium]
MQNKQRYFRIGLLSVITVLLLIGVMFFLGLADEFSEKVHIVTTFSESVQGLTKGAAVKYKGVPIGQVDNISILPREKIIRVDMSINPEVFVGLPQDGKDESPCEQVIKFCRRERAAGLCCYLELSGITGLRYIEMDYMPENRRRLQPLPEINEPDTVYFASVPGTFNNMINSVATSLDKISKINIDQIVKGVDENLEALNRILSDPAIQQTISQVHKASENIEKISQNISENVTGEELKRFITSVNNNLDNINNLTSSLHHKLDQLDTGNINSQISGVLSESRRLLKELQDNRSDVVYTMHKLNAVLDSCGELVDYLKNDPSSVIRGKSSPEVELEQK